MGYTPRVQLVKLTFAEDHEFHGLEVETRAPDIGRVAGLIELGEFVGADPEKVTVESVAKISGLIEQATGIFADHLHSWNVEVPDPGDPDRMVPVPATADGLRSQPDEFVMSLVAEWMKNTVGVSDELGKGSTSGRRSPEVSIPMEPLSRSHAS